MLPNGFPLSQGIAMAVNGVLPISANPVQEGHAVASANQEGGDAAAFAALLYLILGTPQAGTGSTASEEVKPDETKASAAEVVPSQKGSSEFSIANGEPNDPRAFLANDIFAPPAEVAAAAADAAPTPMLKELAASGAKFDGVFTDGSTPKSAAVADERDALIGGGRVEPGAVSEINQDPIEALTVEVRRWQQLGLLNDRASLIQSRPPTALGVTAEAVETDPQVDLTEHLRNSRWRRATSLGAVCRHRNQPEVEPDTWPRPGRSLKR
jgi:hypothetical protein